jgi:hypothetical protein
MPLEKLLNFSLVDLIVLALATYRLSTMLAHDWEAGPAGLLSKLRAKAGLLYTDSGDPVATPGSLAEGLSCIYCNSVWIGLIFTVVYMLLSFVQSEIGFPAIILFLPLALSGAGVLLSLLASWLEAG